MTHPRCIGVSRFLVMAMSTLLAACGPSMPFKDQVAAGDPLPIDGLWEVRGAATTTQFRFERGRMYSVRHLLLRYGQVMTKDIKKTSPTTYSCTTLAIGDASIEVPCGIDVLSPTELVLHTEKNSKVPTADLYFSKLRLDDEASFLQAFARPASPERSSSGSAEVELRPGITRLEATSEIVQIPAGSVLTITRTRTIEHSVNLDATGSLSSGLNVAILDWLRGAIHVELEGRLGKSIKQSETLQHEIVLDGNKASTYRLVWYDRIRTGTARFNHQNTMREIGFKFKEWEDLEVQAM